MSKNIAYIRLFWYALMNSKLYMQNNTSWVDKVGFFIQKLKKTLVTVWKDKIMRKRFIRDAILLSAIGFIIFTTVILLWAASLKTPDLESFDARLLGQSAKIYDRTGTILLYDLSQKIRRTVVPLDQISPNIKKATVAIEDADFYNHKGIRATSVIRAVLANITSLSFSQGGSTITQQVVKNSLLTKEKKISRKIKEWILAIKLEKTADKDTILNLYLNESPYGGNVYGVEEASRLYFAKKSSEVTLAEAAYLAALPQSPTVLSPYGKNKQKLIDRKNLVLEKMLENKLISKAEFDTATTEEVVFQPRSVSNIKAPHFVMFIKEYLEEKYGMPLLEEGGLKIVSTIDYDLQAKAEEIVKDYVLKTGVKTYKATNGAMVAVDPKTGQILMMVGSRDYFDTTIQGNFNVATARRQPGSAFKPFVYAAAFKKGLTPDTPLFDVPTEFNSSCGPTGKPLVTSAKCYSPENYEGGYKGLMSVRSALGQSRNIPAVKALYLAGVDDTLKLAEDMGIQDLSGSSQYGLSLALGGAEVSPLDMASAYGVFAQDGVRNDTVGIIKIEKMTGEVIEEFKADPKEALDNQVARQINNVLIDRYARASIFGSNYFGTRQVGIKSGTTNSSRDAWMVGYTPSISVSAWMGNNDNTPMAQQASARIIGPMWKSFMDFALDRLPTETFEDPDPIPENTKPFLKGTWQTELGEVHSELFWISRSNVKGEAPGYGSNDPLFRNWEAGMQNYGGGFAGQIGTGTTPITPGLPGPGVPITPVAFQIISPARNSSIAVYDRAYISVAGAQGNTTQVQYYVNDSLVGTANVAPFSFSFIPAQVAGIQDENTLKAVLMDNLGKSSEATSFFSVIR
jgi:1A family penicillin-binding protein